MPGNQPTARHDFVPLLMGARVEAHALLVRRQTCTEPAAMPRAEGQSPAANLIDDHRDFPELSRAMTAVSRPTHDPEHPEHAAGCRAFCCRCGCDPARDCRDCHRCACWRAECCARNLPPPMETNR